MERFVLNLVILRIIIRIIVWIVVIFLIRLIIILVPSAAIIVSRMVRLNFLIAALVIITSRLIRTAALVLRRIFFRMKSCRRPKLHIFIVDWHRPLLCVDLFEIIFGHDDCL